MLTAVTGFVAASMLCGQAQTLAEMVLFRVLQGALGAPVIPLSQAVMISAFSPAERGKAMALWGIGIMLGPILGPTLGGFITEHLTWRWVFYINLPVGAINIIMILAMLRPTPSRPAAADWFGVLFMVLGIGSLQVLLDQGNEKNWFESDLIVLLALIAVVNIAAFITRAWRRADSMVNLRLFKDRNFAVSSLLMAAFGLGLFGVISLQPIMLENLFRYPVETTGLVMAPRGLAAAIGMFLVSRLINRIDPRVLLLAGIGLSSAGSFVMSWYSLAVSTFWLVWPGMLQGFGMGLIFVPLSALAYQTLPKEATDEAAGLFNLCRNLGSSIGIATVVTVLSRTTQTNWNKLGGFINPYNPALSDWLSAKGLSLGDPLTPQLLANELSRQASMLGFVDAFWFITVSFLALAPLVLLLRRPRRSNPN
jgi:DHA2 family multidrug resistance protein